MIGTRHGEKLHEALLSREERAVAEDMGEYFRVPPDGRDLNYEKFTEEGEVGLASGEEYNSHNTEQLDLDSLQTLLLKLPFVQRACDGKLAEDLVLG
jgi:UDP-glucose 4-epimerase